MRQVISAPPTVDVSRLAARLAGGTGVVTDPARELCVRHGYQTLYEVPAAQQKALRLELVVAHGEALAGAREGVWDHSVFAWLADWMRWLWSETPAEEWERVLDAARPAVEAADVIHHVTAGPAAAYDGYRWLDARNAAQVERLMRALYRDFGCESRVREVRA